MKTLTILCLLSKHLKGVSLMDTKLMVCMKLKFNEFVHVLCTPLES